MKYIFIGFYGWETDDGRQHSAVKIIRDNYECWDLKKYSFQEFIEVLQKRIPPINANVLRHYVAEDERGFGITEEQYNNCSWGLLLPDPAELVGEGYKEAISVINLFSPCFMRPAFHASDFGITPVNLKLIGNWLHFQNKAPLFRQPSFVDFYEKMISTTRYFKWFRDNVLVWGDEDWRLFMAATFYDGLEEYENAKSIYTWQRESADMSTLLETLFTAGESEKEEIGYRLRKRIFVLIGWKFPEIEKEVKKLYGDRSDYVHGNFFKKIVREMRKNKDGDAATPKLPDFDSLYTAKERIRFILVAYLYLHECMIKDRSLFPEYENVQKLMEDSITKTDLREKVKEVVEPIITLLPESLGLFK